MAAFSNDSELALGGPAVPSPVGVRTLILRASRTSTLSPGHEAILEMHANSQSNAIIYVAVVLALYVLGMSIVVIRYIRTERYEARLARLFHDLVQRDRFFHLSRRRSSLPKTTPDMPQPPFVPPILLPAPPSPLGEMESNL